jgi:hypothetical protein
MNNWMLVGVKYTKQLDNGAFIRVNEPYLLAAMSFTDAEARIYKEIGEIVRGEFIVQSIKRVQFDDIYSFDDSDVWYKVVVKFESFDSDQKSKVLKNSYLVAANSVQEATERIKTELKTILVDYEIVSASITNIQDIFPFNQ